MTAESESAPSNPAQEGIAKIGEGLRSLFGGMLAGTGGAIAPKGNAERSFSLKYNQEVHTVTEGQQGSHALPTVAQAFDANAARLGLETSRERTYRSGESVVDGASRVEYGNTYIASVVRAVKG